MQLFSVTTLGREPPMAASRSNATADCHRAAFWQALMAPPAELEGGGGMGEKKPAEKLQKISPESFNKKVEWGWKILQHALTSEKHVAEKMSGKFW